MPRPRYGLSVCLLICLMKCAPLSAQCIGVALQAAMTLSEPLAPGAQAGARLSFHSTGMGELTDADDVWFAFTQWIASDGVRIIAIHRDFSLNNIAEGYFESRLAKAVKVISRSENRDHSGKIVGERGEILAETNGGIIWGILLTSGGNYWEICSRSMRDNRSFANFSD